MWLTLARAARVFQWSDRMERSPDILIVEDDADEYELYSDFLASCGWAVCGADNGIAAVDAAVRLQPRVILMDAILPGRSGFEAARMLKRDPRTRHIPIVALTGLVARRYVDAAREAGCDSILTKPCPLDRLREEIAEMISRQPAADSRQSSEGG